MIFVGFSSFGILVAQLQLPSRAPSNLSTVYKYYRIKIQLIMIIYVDGKHYHVNKYHYILFHNSIP